MAEQSLKGKTIKGVAWRGVKVCDYFRIGTQITPSFDLSNNHKFAYLSSSLYINGNIIKDGRLFYVTDTWLENDKNELTSAKQWSDLGYTHPLGKSGNNSITPLAVVIHSWKFDQPADLSFGFTHKNNNLYAWTNDILTDHPRFVLAVKFSFSNK